MTIVDRIKAALTVVPGNKVFTLDAFDRYFNGNGEVGALTRDQLSKAIRSQPHIKKFGNGRYIIRGRKTA